MRQKPSHRMNYMLACTGGQGHKLLRSLCRSVEIWVWVLQGLHWPCQTHTAAAAYNRGRLHFAGLQAPCGSYDASCSCRVHHGATSAGHACIGPDAAAEETPANRRVATRKRALYVPVMAIVPRRACWLWGGPFLHRSSEFPIPASSMLRLLTNTKPTTHL